MPHETWWMYSTNECTISVVRKHENIVCVHVRKQPFLFLLSFLEHNKENALFSATKSENIWVSCMRLLLNKTI